jgi:hypothetical protein
MIRFRQKLAGKSWKALLVLAAGLAGFARSAAAQNPPPPPPPTPPPAAAAPAPPTTEIGGLVDAYYDFYSTRPAGNAQYRNFDTLHNQFAFSMAEFWLAKAPTADSRVGFKLKLNFGPATSNFIHAFEPGGSPYQNIQEAYVSYLAPAGAGLQIDAGVFVTPAGAEVIEAKDNPNYSRSLLFALAIPYYHSGVRATYAPNDKLSVTAGLVNGWNNIVENNTGKTVLGSVTFKPNAKVTVAENYIVGPEQANDNDHYRNLSDTVVTLSPDPMATVILNYDFGKEGAGANGCALVSCQWQGLAGLVKLQPTKVIAFTPRVEWYKDRDGFTTGTAQTLKEITATLELKASDNLLWRIEYRRDWSDVATFLNNDTGKLQDNQQSIGFGVMYSFTSKLQ